jgi:hypothetical protein
LSIKLGHGDKAFDVDMYFEKLHSTQEWKQVMLNASLAFKLHDFYDVSDEVLGEGSKSIVVKGNHRVHKIDVAIRKLLKEKAPSEQKIV